MGRRGRRRDDDDSQSGVGRCGGVPFRHTYGLIELRKYFDSFRLVAVCDRNESAAEHVAGVAERELGERPAVFDDFDTMLSAVDSLDAVDVAADTASHHTIAEAALRAGLHVIVEKPMGVTLKACRRMYGAAAAAGRTLAIAENYRRDPLCRLAKALLDAGVIGEPRLALDVSVGGGDALMHNTSWRALRSRGGGFILEQGVHNADLLLYYLGEVESVFAETSVLEKTLRRRGISADLQSFYSHRADDVFSTSETIEADAVDTGVAVMKFRSGAVCQLTMSRTSPGSHTSLATVHGSLGTMVMPASRSGIGPTVMLEGREPLRGEALLELVPDMTLDEPTAAHFGGSRPIASYGMSFEEVDRALVAIELEDFARAIRTGRRPEVDQEAGMRAVALVYAVLESGETGVPVKLRDVMDGTVAEYQRSVDEENDI
ncbi:MAG: Gfo/Idh/MocA family oxidoreductase [Chloroflexi bacterium]|nr:Gfo/Idh/MocA family oxidoreductase [Chloroflexota bacterium]